MIPHVIIVAGLVALAIAVCLPELGREPLWFDEHMTVYWSSDIPLSQLKASTASNRHSTFYYSVLRPWFDINPEHGNAYLRLSSVLLFVSTIPVAYALVRMATARTEHAIIAGLLLATTPVLVEHARELRPEGMMMLLTSASLLILAAIIKTGTADHTPLISTIRAGNWRLLWRDALWLGLSASVLLPAATHPTAIVFGFVPAAVFAAYTLLSPRRVPVRAGNYVLAMLPAAALYAALYLPAFQVSYSVAGPYVGKYKLGLWLGGQYLDHIILLYGNQYVWPQIFIHVALAGLGLTWLARRKEYTWAAMFALGTLLFVALMFSVGLGTGRLRAIVWTVIPFTCLLGVGVAAIRLPTLRYVVLAVVLALNGLGVYAEYHRVKEPYYDLARFVAEEVRPDDVLVYSRGDRPLTYALKQLDLQLPVEPVSVNYERRLPDRPHLTINDIPALYPDRKIVVMERNTRTWHDFQEGSAHELVEYAVFAPGKVRYGVEGQFMQRRKSGNLSEMVPLVVYVYEPIESVGGDP